MSEQMLYYMGKKTHSETGKIDKTMLQWDIFSVNPNFLKWVKKHKLAANQLDAFRRGFVGEKL